MKELLQVHVVLDIAVELQERWSLRLPSEQARKHHGHFEPSIAETGREHERLRILGGGSLSMPARNSREKAGEKVERHDMISMSTETHERVDASDVGA